MDEQEAEDFNDEVIRVLRKFAPWAVEHIEDSVRRGKAVAKRVARKGAKRTATIVEDTKPFGSSTFVETQDLTATEKLGITLDAVERLLIHPALIVEEIRKTLVEAELVGVAFAEPGDPKEAARARRGRSAHPCAPA